MPCLYIGSGCFFELLFKDGISASFWSVSNDTLQEAFAKLPFAESRRNFVEIITSDENHEGSCPGVLHGTLKNMSFFKWNRYDTIISTDSLFFPCFDKDHVVFHDFFQKHVPRTGIRNAMLRPLRRWAFFWDGAARGDCTLSEMTCFFA